MAGTRRGISPFAPARRARVETVKWDLYDRAHLNNVAGTVATTLFVNASGAVAATAINGVSKTKADTNMETAGKLASPKSMEVWGFSQKLHFAAPGAALSTAVVQADLDALLDGTFLRWRVGEKFYLTSKLHALPSGVNITGLLAMDNAGAVAIARVAALSNGRGHVKNVLPVWVPEEKVSPVTKRIRTTGKRVPVNIPPEQNFRVTFESPGGLAAITVDHYLLVTLHGFLMREVQ